MPPALRKPKHGHQPRGYLASPAIAVHLVKESAVADSAGIAWRNERGGTDTRRIGKANFVDDGTAPQHFLIALVGLPIRQQHPRPVPPDEIGRIVSRQLLGISANH